MELLYLLTFLIGWFVCWIQGQTELRNLKLQVSASRQLQLNYLKLEERAQQLESWSLDYLNQNLEMMKELETEKLQKEQLEFLLSEQAKKALAWKKATEWDLQ